MKDHTLGSRDLRGDAKFRFYLLLTASAAFLLLASVAAVPALSSQGVDETAQEVQLAQAGFSEDQLEAFAVASLEVQAVNEKWMTRIAEAESAEKGQELREQAIEEMTGAVRNEGLTVEEYNRIYDAAENDPEIAAIVQDYRSEHGN